MIQQNKKTVLTFIEAMGKGDADTAATCITDDVFTLAKGFGKFAGVRERETILATIAAFHILMPKGMEPTIHVVIAESNRVVVEFEGNGILCNGESYCNEYCMVFTMDKGKIKQVNEYFCTLLADQMLYPLVAGQGL